MHSIEVSSPYLHALVTASPSRRRSNHENDHTNWLHATATSDPGSAPMAGYRLVAKAVSEPYGIYLFNRWSKWFLRYRST